MDDCFAFWGFVVYSHNASFIIVSISYNFWLFFSFYFALMIDAFLVSFDLIFVYDAFAHWTYSCLFIFAIVVLSGILS